MQYILQNIIQVLVRETILIPKTIFHTLDSKMKIISRIVVVY